MKKIIALLCAVAASAFLFIAQARPKAETAQVTYQTNLHCDKCAKKISENVSFEKGVKDLTIDVDKKTVTIKYETGKTDVEKLAAAIRKLGYTAKAIPAAKPVEAK